jgi:APA family basic amino acid/polyamine antiporter
LYILFAYVMVGVANYRAFGGGDSSDHLAPVATAIEHMGTVGANGVITPAYPWLNTTIIIAILLGYSSVILVMLLGQSRVFYSMSNDGLLPGVFSRLHSRYRTPSHSNALFMLFVSLFAAFVPGRVVGEMTSIGTLFAFILVCIGVLILRKSNPNAPRAFKVPLVPLVPILGVLVCFGMMAFLPFDTWIRLIVWMLIGLDVYLFYGIRSSILNKGADFAKSYKIVSLTGIILSVALVIVALAHHYTAEVQDNAIFWFSIIFAILHFLLFISKRLSGKTA